MMHSRLALTRLATRTLVTRRHTSALHHVNTTSSTGAAAGATASMKLLLPLCCYYSTTGARPNRFNDSHYYNNRSRHDDDVVNDNNETIIENQASISSVDAENIIDNFRSRFIDSSSSSSSAAAVVPRTEELNTFIMACGVRGHHSLALYAMKRFPAVRNERSVDIVIDAIFNATESSGSRSSRSASGSRRRTGGSGTSTGSREPLSQIVARMQVLADATVEYDELTPVESVMYLLMNVLQPQERTVDCFEVVVRNMVKQGFVLEAHELIAIMPALFQVDSTPLMCGAVLHALASNMYLDEAWHCLDHMLKREMNPGAIALNALIFGLVSEHKATSDHRRDERALREILRKRQRNMTRALCVLQIMETQFSITPNTFAINTLMQGCIRSLWYTEAVKLFLTRMTPSEDLGMQFASFGAEPNFNTSIRLASLSENDQHDPEHRVPFKPPGQALVQPDANTFEILFRTSWMLGTLREMIYHDELTQREYLHQKHSARMLRSRMWLSVMQMKGILTCFCNSYPRLQSTLESSPYHRDIMSNVERLAFILKKTQREHRQFELFVKGKCPLLLTLFPQLIAPNTLDPYQLPMVVTVTLHEPSISHMVSHMLHNLGRVRDALKIVGQFFADEYSLMRPDHKILKMFTLYFSMNMTRNPRAKQSLDVYRKLVDGLGIKPSEDAVSCLISALAFENRIHDIRAVVEHAASLGVKPTGSMYNPMMHAASKDRDGVLPWTIKSLLTQMHKNGLEPNSGTVHILVTDLISRDKIEEALNLVREFLRKDPREQQQPQQQLHQQQQQQMKKRRPHAGDRDAVSSPPPSSPPPVESKTINLLVTALIQKNRVHDSFKLCEELLHSNYKECRPTLTTYRLMIAALERRGDISKAYYLFETVKSMVDIGRILSTTPVHARAENSTIQDLKIMYDVLIRGFAARGQRDVTTKLFEEMDPRLKNEANYMHMMKLLVEAEAQPSPSGVSLETLALMTDDERKSDLGDMLSSLVDEMRKNGLNPLDLEYHPQLRAKEQMNTNIQQDD